MYVSISPLVSFSLFSLPFLLFPFPSPPSLVYYPLDPYSCSLFFGHFRPPLSLHITGPRCEVPVASCFRWPIVRRVHTRSASSLSAQLSHHPLPIFNKVYPTNQLLVSIARFWINSLPPPFSSTRHRRRRQSLTRSLAQSSAASFGHNTAFAHHSSQPATTITVNQAVTTVKVSLFCSRVDHQKFSFTNGCLLCFN